MGLMKRKSLEDPSEESSPPLKQQRENDLIITDESVACVHDVSYPEGYVPCSNLSLAQEDSKPAKEFPFKLDPFQSEAINCLDSGESVMVSAHTSAGKTVVALYAIAMSLRNKQRVIYTSPIKALSNQKYREFKEEFSDVGLMTGDVTIDPNASCLVMTTEIWRSMQYKGSEITREVAWVIFDEVHYMRDRERGVVWEESIVMAPKNSRFVFLSATVPNAKEFADWVAKVHQQPCHIVYTDYRPTPLQHYVFPSGGDGLYLVVDENGKFREDSFQKALNALVPSNEGDRKRENGKWKKNLAVGKAGEESDIFKMVKMIIQRQYDPVILFSFSKRECETLAMQMAKMDLNVDDEKVTIETIFWSAMDMLSDDDKKLPQVSNMLPLLKRGIGVHHSGLLPILKEVIEILFQEGLIKCLFATETFSIGLNMPAKTVVFTNVRKFDGDKFRWISSGEYIQMSGRAGRRGIDDRGICILMVDEKLEPSTAKMMLKGSADSLNSAFHLSYNMLLNQMRCEDGDPENLLRNSFYQFQADRAIPDLEKQRKDLEKERDSIVIEEEDSLENYYSLLEQYKSLKKDVRDIVFAPRYCLPFLQPGRLVSIQCTKSDETSSSFSIEDQVTWGVIINFERVKGRSEDDANRKPEDANYTVDVLTKCAVRKDEVGKKTIKIIPLKERGEPVVVSVPISQVDSLSSVRLMIPKDLLPLEARENTLKKVSEVLSRFAKEGMPLLDPEEDMKVQSSSYRKAVRRIEALENLFEKHEIAKSPLIEQKLKVLHMKKELTAKIKLIKRTIRSSTALAFKDELKARKRVLRRLGYVTSDDVVELKGKVACEISSADELTLTELMFNGVFKDIKVEEMVSLLSCFVWQEKLQDAQKPRDELEFLFTQLQDTARRVAKVLLKIFMRTAGLIDNVASSGGQAAATLRSLVESQRLCCRIFYSLNFQELPEFFEDHMGEWMGEFQKYLTVKYPSLEDGGGDGLVLVDELRAAVCENISLYMEKNEEEFQGYLGGFVEVVWNLLVAVSASSSRDRLTVTAIKFLTTVSTSVHHTLFARDDILQQICQSIVIPNVMLRDEDEELFEMNYVEFIRRDMEGSDLDTRRRIACELLKGIATNYKEKVTQMVSSQIQSSLALFAENPSANWKHKDCAIYLVVSLATKKAGGTSVSTDLVDVESFFRSVIVPELQNQDVDGFPMLKAGALKFFTMFRTQISKPIAMALIPEVVRFLGSESNVVHSYAASCIEKLLLVKDDGGRARYISSDISPFLLVLMTNLFSALGKPESEENPYVMKCIMRVLGVADISREVASPCITGLTSVLNKVCENPKNPIFNHYLFEAVAVLVRRSCEKDPSLISAFEASLFPSLQLILAKDVTEFFPYAFQLLAQLVELNRPPIPPHYMQIFEILLLPDSWKRSGNVPALVRLLQAFLQKASHELNQEGRLTQVLGIFNKLVSSPSTDDQGFYVLNTVIENLGYDVIAPYMGHIWASLFTRLQNSRTVKFVKSFLIFMSLFLVKHGSQNLVDSMNGVQPNIFLLILEQFWIPNLKLITGSIELKLTSVASIRLICESPALLDPASSRHWGKMLDSIVTLLSRPEQDRVEEESDVPDFGDNVGYGATFVHLHNAGKKAEDPLRDVRDPKQFLVASLANLSARSPGRYPQVISENLDTANQAALLQLCSSYNLSIV